MATYRLSVSIIGRSSGRSAIAAAAYRAGQNIGGHDFSAKTGVVWSSIFLPEGALPWMADRESLWQSAEAAEKRCDARLARETCVSLPRELDREQQKVLVREFVEEAILPLGMVADVAIHEVPARDGTLQAHAHVLTTTRAIDPDSLTGFGLKVPDWDRRELLLAWREAWADHVNDALERAGREERVDHRSLAERCAEAVRERDFGRAAELDREPEPKVGWKAWAWEKRGVLTERGGEWRAALARNVERSHVYEVVAEAGAAARERFLELRERAGDVWEAVEKWAAEYGERARGAARVGYAVGTVLGAGVVGAVMYEQRLERTVEEVLADMWSNAAADGEKASGRVREDVREEGPDPASLGGFLGGSEDGRAEVEERAREPGGPTLASAERGLAAGYEADELDGLVAAALEERGEVEASSDRERVAEERERGDGEERER